MLVGKYLDVLQILLEKTTGSKNKIDWKWLNPSNSKATLRNLSLKQILPPYIAMGFTTILLSGYNTVW